MMLLLTRGLNVINATLALGVFVTPKISLHTKRGTTNVYSASPPNLNYVLS